MKKFSLILIAALAFSSVVFAQSADKVTELIESPKATWGQMAYLSATYLGLVQEDASYEDSLSALQQNKLASSDVSPDQSIRLDDLALLCSKTFRINSSLMYLIVRNRHYAFRQLQASGMISKTSDPSRIYNGHQAINLFNNCMDIYGKNRSAASYTTDKAAAEKTSAPSENQQAAPQASVQTENSAPQETAEETTPVQAAEETAPVQPEENTAPAEETKEQGE